MERDKLIECINSVKSDIRNASSRGENVKGYKKELKRLAGLLADMDSLDVTLPHPVFRGTKKGAKRIDLSGYVNPDGADVMDEDWRDEA